MREANLNSEGVCGAIVGGVLLLLVEDGLDRVMVYDCFDYNICNYSVIRLMVHALK